MWSAQGEDAAFHDNLDLNMTDSSISGYIILMIKVLFTIVCLKENENIIIMPLNGVKTFNVILRTSSLYTADILICTKIKCRSKIIVVWIHSIHFDGEAVPIFFLFFYIKEIPISLYALQLSIKFINTAQVTNLLPISGNVRSIACSWEQ